MRASACTPFTSVHARARGRSPSGSSCRVATRWGAGAIYWKALAAVDGEAEEDDRGAAPARRMVERNLALLHVSKSEIRAGDISGHERPEWFSWGASYTVPPVDFVAPTLPSWIPQTPEMLAALAQGDTFEGYITLADTSTHTLKTGKIAQRQKKRLVGCGSGAHVWDNYSTVFPFHWKYNNNYEPSYLDPTRTLQSLRDARTEWELSYNWCSFPDNSSANFTYDGLTNIQFDWAAGGTSTVGFGNIAQLYPDCAALQCLGFTIVRHSGSSTVEGDTRLQYGSPYGYNWSNVAANNHYCVQCVQAHETGHVLGFQHASSPDVLMYPTYSLGDYTGIYLGYGDWYVNGAAY